MATTTAILTADDLLRLPDDGLRHELVRGVLVSMAPPGFDHGSNAALLANLLVDYVRTRALGRVLVETGFILERDPDLVRAPDVSFVIAERVPPPGQGAGYFPGAPDLAVEIVSPSDTMAEVQQKVQEYLAAGSRLVWVVESRSRTVTAYRPDGTAQVCRERDALTGEDVLPGFSVPVAELFA